ncbi:MAG: hypothetical protein PHS30_01415 [Bacteroidales bacterium]|nr:hypothetical protein [Bacteroidales bacterium]
MLSNSNFENLSQTGVEAGVTDSPAEKVQDARDKLKEARENLIKAREELVQVLKDSVEDFKNESQEKNNRNATIIAEFRKKAPATQNELIVKYHIKVDELEKKNSEMKKKLDEYIVEGKGKWVSFKHEYNHDMIGLEKALKDLTLQDEA